MFWRSKPSTPQSDKNPEETLKAFIKVCMKRYTTKPGSPAHWIPHRRLQMQSIHLIVNEEHPNQSYVDSQMARCPRSARWYVCHRSNTLVKANHSERYIWKVNAFSNQCRSVNAIIRRRLRILTLGHRTWDSIAHCPWILERPTWNAFRCPNEVSNGFMVLEWFAVLVLKTLDAEFSMYKCCPWRRQRQETRSQRKAQTNSHDMV